MTKLILTLFAALLLTAAAFAAPMTYTGNMDIGEMMNEAQKVWDFEDHDSIILLEGVRYSWTSDMRLTEKHHRVVWISTEHGLDHYSDLRIAYDSDRQDLKVDALRTWRDDRWIEPRSTAVVPTTPYAFRRAPDYTSIRETMLLHDGVELPCILECSYTIEDKKAYRSGFEGQFIFQRNDPTLNSWLIVEAAEGFPMNVQGFNGVVEASRELPSGESLDQVYSFRMKNVEPAPLPANNDPAGYLPHVQWSTYTSWNALGNVIKGEFLTRSMMNDALKDSLNMVLKDAETMVQKAHRVADFVDSHQRYIGYDSQWFLPRVRMASRTYETGYGVAMDQCVLTAALMREAGFEVWPVLLSSGYGNVDEGVATFARFRTPGVWVSGPGVEAYWDPATGTLHNGLAPIYNRSVWLPGFDEKPVLRWSGDGQGSRIMTSFELSWDADAEMWTGSGYYEAGGGYSPFDQMEGGGDRSSNYLNSVAAGVFSGADVTEFSPMSFDRFTVASDLSLTVPAGDADDLGRTPFVFGAPAGGLLDMIPGNVPLHLAERGTPVSLPGAGEQMVKLKLHLGDFEVAHLPEAISFSNDAGSFELKVEQEGDVVTLTRSTNINASTYSAEDWPELRSLLLAESSASNRTIFIQ
jgi:Domain of Unknown Function with PDB structure (DUF3857)/Domain of Unknown Function with PDB structure (DUF3858)